MSMGPSQSTERFSSVKLNSIPSTPENRAGEVDAERRQRATVIAL